MKCPATFALLICCWVAALPSTLRAADNIYTNSVSGKWEDTNNWSTLTAPSSSQFIYITNAGSKILTIDATTSGTFPGSMTIGNLSISGRGADTNILFLNAAGLATPLHVSGITSLSNNYGLLILNNSAMRIDQDLQIGAFLGASNSVIVTNGSTLATGGAGLGASGAGASNSITVSGPSSFWTNAGGLVVGNNAPGRGITIANGAAYSGRNVIVGWGGSADGQQVLVTDSGSSWTNWTLSLEHRSAEFVVSNRAVAYCTNLIIAAPGNGSETNNSVMVTGSNSLFHVPGPVSVGNGTAGHRLTISNAATMIVTNGAHSARIDVDHAALTVAGGTLLTDHLALTNNASASITQGTLLVTNAAGTALTVMNGSSLLHGAGLFKTDNLLLTNGGSVITISNYALGTLSGTTNLLNLSAGSSLIISNAALGIGNDGTTSNGSGNGIVTLSNAFIQAPLLNIGSTAGGIGSLLVQSNASVNLASNLTMVSSSLSDTSSIILSGGTLMLTNGVLSVGSSGSARVTLTNATLTARDIKLGGTNLGSSGTLIVGPGAHLNFFGKLSVNLVGVPGGDANGNGGDIVIGEDHDAAFYVVGAGQVTNVANLYAGYSSGSTGSFTNEGTVTIRSNFIVGNCTNNGANGIAILNGGSVFVTNAAHDAVLTVRKGTLFLQGGTLVADRLVLMDDCGRFIKTGGTLQCTNLDLNPNIDSDGDGHTNGQEELAGTDPLDPESNLHITAVTITNSSQVRIEWAAVSNHSYIMQSATNLLVPTWFDLNPPVVVNGGEQTGAYTHTGAATNRATFYRVRLGP